MKKLLILFIVLTLFSSIKAQYGGVYISPRIGYSMGYHPYPRGNNYKRDSSYRFKPSMSINVGYGLPNLDKYQFAQTYQFYNQPYSETGPIAAAIDYRFSRTMAVGLLITSGTSKTNYYDYYSNNPSAAFQGKLSSTAIMLDLVNYMPVNNNHIAPYLRTALGVNIWNEDYYNTNGNKINFSSYPTDFAYQVSIGSNFYIAEHVGFFAEVGYGKYIFNAGLAFKF